MEYRHVLLVSPARVHDLAGVLRVSFGSAGGTAGGLAACGFTQEVLVGDWDDEQVARQLKLLTKVAEIVIPNLTTGAITADDDNNLILERAVAGKADLIVSGDHHLRDLKSFRNIGTIRPVDFHLPLSGTPRL